MMNDIGFGRAKRKLKEIVFDDGGNKLCPFAGQSPCAKGACRMWNDDMKFCCLDSEGLPFILYDAILGVLTDNTVKGGRNQ